MKRLEALVKDAKDMLSEDIKEKMKKLREHDLQLKIQSDDNKLEFEKISKQV